MPVDLRARTKDHGIKRFAVKGYRAPHSWAERSYHNLIYINEVGKDDHFASWEQPELFSVEIRAAFRSLR